jgi:hypothetical protein
LPLKNKQNKNKTKTRKRKGKGKDKKNKRKTNKGIGIREWRKEGRDDKKGGVILLILNFPAFITSPKLFCH